MDLREKLLKAIAARQLVGCYNNTRWRQLTDNVKGLPLRSRIKWVFEPEPTTWGTWSIPTNGYLEHDGLGPVPFREIEWLEIDSVERQYRGRLVSDKAIDRSHEVAAILNAHRVVFTEKGKIYRIYGYIDASDPRVLELS